jgi:hypothetical protein
MGIEAEGRPQEWRERRTTPSAFSNAAPSSFAAAVPTKPLSSTDASSSATRPTRPLAERERAARETLDRAAEALSAGDRHEARQLIRHALRDGADPERAHVLLDRLDGRTGRIGEPTVSVSPVGDAPAHRRSFSWSRPVLTCLWVGALALAAASAASSFDHFVGRLAGPPVPAARSAGGAR